jgi:peptidoglycan DL-endopeptidase CwlO
VSPASTPAARRRGAAGAVLGALLLPIVGIAPAHADPSTEDVQDRIDDLEREFSQLNDDYNAAMEDHEAAERRLEDIEEDIADLEEDLEGLREAVRGVAVAAYSGGDVGSPAYLLSVADPDDALISAADLNYLSDAQREALDAYLDELDRLESLEADAASAEEQAAEDLETAEAAREEGEAAIEEQQELLDELEADEEAEREAAEEAEQEAQEDSSSGGSGGSSGASAGGAAGVALDYAMAQVGKSYCWGGTGPGCYDCSGLTSMAWAEAGVNLPRTAAQQFNAGTRVSWGDLQPGDLLFFYNSSAPSHVGMYAGDGRMVHASNSSRPVQVDSLAGHYQSEFVGAVRP